MSFEVHEGLVPFDTLMIHGNLASNTWWEPTITELRSRVGGQRLKGRLICGEWRGCGKSSRAPYAPKSTQDLLPQQMAQDYLALLQELGVQKTHVVAHSLGGLIALEALLADPKIFANVVLLDPVSSNGVQFPQAAIDAFVQMSRDREFCALVMSGTIQNVDVADPLFQKIVDDSFAVAPLIWTEIPKVLRDVDISSRIKEIQQSILVLHGELDPVLPKSDSAALASALPHARYQELKGHGHSTNVEDPKYFTDLFYEFLYGSPTWTH